MATPTTRSWAAAAASAPPRTTDSSSSSRERTPVGLRPVTQQQLEARHFRRTASAPPEAALRSSSNSNTRAARGASSASVSIAAAASGDDDDGWTSVASKSRWNRSHKRAGLPPARAAAVPPPPPLPVGASYSYSWATTAVMSAGGGGGSAGSSLAATAATYSKISVVAPREESARALSLKQQPAVGASPKRDYGRRTAATQRSRSLEQSVRMPRSGVRSPPPASDGGVWRNTSLQQLLAKIEFEDDEIEQQQQQQYQQQQPTRKRNDQGGGTGGQDQPKSSTESAKPATAPQKCGDKRDFFFRNLEFETRNRLQIDDVAGFSVTEHEMATKISEAIVELFECTSAAATGDESPSRPTSLVITDATACIGGNVISFCDYFAIVNAVECDLTRCEMLQHNLAVLNKGNAICVHASYLLVMHDLQQDVVFIDPPWGGPEYKDLAKVDLFLDDVPLYDICKQLHGRAKVVVLKVPTNFDADKFAEHVPGKVDVRKDFHKMHLVVIDYREAHGDDQEASGDGEQPFHHGSQERRQLT